VHDVVVFSELFIVVEILLALPTGIMVLLCMDP